MKTKSQDATEGAFPESIWKPIGENLYTAGWLQLTQNSRFARGPFVRAMLLLRRSYFFEGWARLLNSHHASLASGSCQAHLREEQRKKRLRFVLLVAQCQASGATWWKNVVCAFLVFNFLKALASRSLTETRKFLTAQTGSPSVLDQGLRRTLLGLSTTWSSRCSLVCMIFLWFVHPRRPKSSQRQTNSVWSLQRHHLNFV